MLGTPPFKIVHNGIYIFVPLALRVCIAIDFVNGSAWSFPGVATNATTTTSARRECTGGTIRREPLLLLLATTWRIGG